MSQQYETQEQFEMYRRLIHQLKHYGVENPEEFVASDAYNNGIEVECKVISITLLDDKCQTSLVKQGYPLR